MGAITPFATVIVSCLCLCSCLSTNRTVMSEVQGSKILAVLPVWSAAGAAHGHPWPSLSDRKFFDDWRVAIPTPSGTQGHFVANGKAGTVKIDVPTLRGEVLVYSFCEYMYPREVRLSDDGSTVFLIVAGSYPSLFGRWDRTWVFACELSGRKRIVRTEYRGDVFGVTQIGRSER